MPNVTERTAQCCRGPVTALLTFDEEGVVSFPRDEEGRSYLTIITGFEMTPKELTMMVLEIKSHRRFWNVTSMTTSGLTVVLPSNFPPEVLVAETASVLLDCAVGIDRLHWRPAVNSSVNNEASRTGRTEDDVALKRWLRSGSTRNIRTWLSTSS